MSDLMSSILQNFCNHYLRTNDFKIYFHSLPLPSATTRADMSQRTLKRLASTLCLLSPPILLGSVSINLHRFVLFQRHATVAPRLHSRIYRPSLFSCLQPSQHRPLQLQLPSKSTESSFRRTTGSMAIINTLTVGL